MSEIPESWITEVRTRLAAPPPRALPEGAPRAAALVPLYVDAGALWVLLLRRDRPSPLHAGRSAFAMQAVEPGEEPWSAAERAGEEALGLDDRLYLPLGELDEVLSASGHRVVPCVVAVPAGVETRLGEEVAETFGVPLFTLGDPRLLEERRVEVDGEVRAVTVLHLGRRTVWGVTASILVGLLERLGVQEASEGSIPTV